MARTRLRRVPTLGCLAWASLGLALYPPASQAPRIISLTVQLVGGIHLCLGGECCLAKGHQKGTKRIEVAQKLLQTRTSLSVGGECAIALTCCDPPSLTVRRSSLIVSGEQSD